MWKASGNNMVMGTDLTVDTSSTAKQLFSLTTSGQAKLQSTVYTKFKGEIFRSINCEKEKNRNTFSLSSSDSNFLNYIQQNVVRTLLLASFSAGAITSAPITTEKNCKMACRIICCFMSF